MYDYWRAQSTLIDVIHHTLTNVEHASKKEQISRTVHQTQAQFARDVN